MVDKISKIACVGRRGFSLIELMVVITIIALVAAGMIGVANHVQLNAKTRNTKMTITLLNNALEEYKAFKDTGKGEDVWPDTSLMAPTTDGLEGALKFFCNNPSDFLFVGKPGHDPMLNNIEFLCYCLSDVPKCQEILDSIPDRAKSNSDRDSIVAYGQEKTLIEVLDAWEHPIQYEHAAGSGNVPVLTSAGEDEEFDSADDIISSEF